MERVVARGNLLAALARVKRHEGSPGVDGMTVEALPGYLREQWPQIREALLAGTYRPQPVKRVDIPKPGGGVRQLGVPTVLARFIQQALLQVLQPAWDATFSEGRYGFRPGRSAHRAVAQAQRYLSAGYGWVVDLDLEKCFDRVHHDTLMSLVNERVADRRVLQRIDRDLKAGARADGGLEATAAGTPQGVPCRPCWQSCCWMVWTRSWSIEGTGSCAMRTMVTCTSRAHAPASGCWPVWRGSWRDA